MVGRAGPPDPPGAILRIAAQFLRAAERKFFALDRGRAAAGARGIEFVLRHDRFARPRLRVASACALKYGEFLSYGSRGLRGCLLVVGGRRWQQDAQSASSAQSVATPSLLFRLRHGSGLGCRRDCEAQGITQTIFLRDAFFEVGPLVAASLCHRAVRCGNPRCRCARGTSGIATPACSRRKTA